MHALDGCHVHAGVDDQLVASVDALDYQDTALEFDLTFRIDPETTASGGDPARLERAPERADQSTSGSGHDVVEGGRVRRTLA